MAERAPAGTAALIAAAMDSGEAGGERDGVSSSAPARFGLVALDESLDGEDRPQAVLRERLAMEIDLSACHHRDIGDAPAFDLADARRRLPSVIVPDGAVESLCAAPSRWASTRAARPCWRSGPRAPARRSRAGASCPRRMFSSRPARAGASRPPPAAGRAGGPCAGRTRPRPTRRVGRGPPARGQGAGGDDGRDPRRPPEDAAGAGGGAALPRERQGGESRAKALRGRPIGSRRGDLRSRARLDLLDTLRAAAPWQRAAADPTERSGCAYGARMSA